MTVVSNPVLSGFHPDPSILRVGDTYYIANSTFEWYPGVEIHFSKDLANWQSAPSPLSQKTLLDMTGNSASCGIWAPCLSFCGGTFYLVFTNVRNWKGPWKDAPNYLTTAPSINGPWSKPVFLNCSGFDASLFHDDDGKKWLLNMEWDYRKETAAYKFTGILLQQYSPARKRLTGPVRKIFTGTAIQLVEGPHLYKRNGRYYLLTAEGGTQYGHAVTVARSQKIEGPYETHPHNPVLTSYAVPDWPLQKAGHASWCETADGRFFLAFLCGRPLSGTRNCPLGRETAIAELEWRDDWPYIKYEHEAKANMELFGRTVPNYPPLVFAPPVPVAPQPAAASRHYTFNGSGGIPADFKTLRIPADKDIYSLSARPGFLRLRGGQSPVSNFQQTLLARRQTDFSFSAETYMEASPKSFQEMSGLCWRYDEKNWYLLALSHDEEKGSALSVQIMDGGKYTRTEDTAVAALNGKTGIWLGLTVTERQGLFRYSLDGKNWNTLRPVLDAVVLSDEYYYEGFTGAFVGIFCVDTARHAATADFEYFRYTAL